MPLDCPRCFGVKLQEIDVNNVIVDRCTRCAGLWFDNDELYELLDRRQSMKQFESTIPTSEFAVEGLRCPRCVSVNLRKMTICEPEGPPVIFRCASCSGTWIDRGALRIQEDPSIAQSVQNYFDKICGGRD